jgi:hypothetical protein
MSGPFPIPTVDNCTCENICPDSPDCTCIWFENIQACVCSCAGAPPPHLLKVKAAMDSKVNVTSRNAKLGKFARFLSEVCEAEILIPAARLDEKLSLYEKGVTIGEVARKVGLVVR